MKIELANKFLIIGLLLYIIAGAAVINKMNYNIVILLGAIIFLALGFFAHMKLKWSKFLFYWKKYK